MKYKFFKNVDTIEELYAQYKKLAMKHHPDHGGNLEDMQQINAEYDELKRKVGNIHKTATGETYTNEQQTTQTPDRFKDIINAVINFDIDLELCGCWLWAFNAYNYREQLKNLGFFYCSQKHAWAWTDEPSRKKSQRMTLEEIRNNYGSEVIKTRKDDTKKIKAVN